MSSKKSDSKVRDLIAAAGVLIELLVSFVRGLAKRGVTGEQVYRLATEEGKPVLERVLDAVAGVLVPVAQFLGIIEEVTDIVPPPGGKVFRVLVRVDWTKNWREFIFANCPQTGHDWDVLTVGDQYEPVNLKEEVLLVWFGKGVRIMAERADAWAEKNGLVQSHGRIPVAVIGSVGDIVDQLKKCGFPYDSAGVVSTSSCKLGGDSYVPYAWRYYDGGRGARLSHVSDGWRGNSLFAFSRK